MTAELTCPHCHFSKTVPREKIPPNARWAVCPSCNRRFEFNLPPATADPLTQGGRGNSRFHEGAEDTASPREGAPWENRDELGLWQSIFQTFKGVLFTPEKLFSTLRVRDGLSEPLGFGLLVGSVGSMVGLFWQSLKLSEGLLSFTEFFSEYTAALFFTVALLFVPLLVTLGIFIYSGALHLLLLVVGGGKKGYEATFRVVSYSQAAQAWGLVPFIGGWIGGIWQLIIQVIGLREIHGTSYWRVIIAFLIPVALISLLLIALVLPFMLSVFS